MPDRRFAAALAFSVLAAGCKKAAPPEAPAGPPRPGELLTGEGAKGDFTTDAPGVRRKLTVADLPPPFQTDAADNGPSVVDRPKDAWPKVPPGFKVEVFAAGLTNPRQMRVAPNGDVFVVESKANQVRVLRDANHDGKPELVAIYADDLKKPFGVAFWPQAAPKFVYVGNTDSIVRFPYESGDTKARGPAEVVVDDISGGGLLRGGGHWTRDVVFSKDDQTMFVSVGSHSNVSDDEIESKRARIFAYTPEGKDARVYATGIRNAVGLAIEPVTGALWASVNERDNLGDHLVPDYVTHVEKGGFYGWPWFYLGDHQDPRHAGKHPELKGQILVPDVLLQSHSASLGMTFPSGRALPAEYRGSAFAAEHGSWNRARRTGYKVIRVPTKDGKATGEYVDFMTGFVASNDAVWGRPVAVAEASDGAILVTDDAGQCVWRVSATTPAP